MSAPNDFGSSDGAPAQPPQGMSPPEGFAMPQGMTPPEGLPTTAPEAEENEGAGASVQPPNFGGMLDFGKGNSDVKLQYIDDNPDSYANIFDNAKTNINKNDKKRLVEALKTLSGENARNAVFTDEVIHYLVVHDFLQNDDSYTGMMVHNYYLYEEKGKLAIIPWDYNLAFGGMGAGGSATATINSPIDSPISSGSSSDRPLVGWIFSDDEALEDYHESYGQFIADTIENGWLEREIGRVSAMIRPYVEADKNSFYSAEEFDSAIDALQSYCALRGESIRGQLNGTIPSTSEGQRADSSALIDARGLSISAMGAMHMGGGPSNSFEIPGGDRPGNPPDSFGDPSGIPNTSDMPGQGYFPTMPDVSETRDDSFDGSAGFSTQQAETIMPEMTEHPENEEKLKTENVESSEMDEGTSTRLRENSRSGFVAPSGGTLLDARQVAGSSMSWVEL